VLITLSARCIRSKTYPQDVDAWLKEVGLGPYAPEVEDWDAIYEKAKQEGRVVIYTSSSRTIQIKDEFEALYPGIEVEVYHSRYH
jgi:iron(III) transport system substrate-binding protein